MTEPLRIFISHKMNTDTELAEDIGSKLSLYAGSQVVVTHAGKFRYGERWRERIEEQLNRAHWLILLFTDPDEDWGFCLFECGYFRRIMESDTTKRLITFCRRQDQISEALKEFNALVMTEQAVEALLKDIYWQDPWKVKPDLDPAVLKGNSSYIVTRFMGTERIVANFDVAASVIIDLFMTESIKTDLTNGRLPPETAVSGTKDWQQVFGRAVDTGGWLWKDLVANWPFADVYTFLIAKMISDALNGPMPKGAIFRAPGESKDLYRITLRRYERWGENRYRFYFTASPHDLPFDLPEPGRTAEETILYHLVCLTWYFRRRVVDQVYTRLLEVRSMKDRDQKAAVGQVYDDIRRELMQSAAHAIVRRLDNSYVVEQTLVPFDEDSHALVERIKAYDDLQEHIFEAMRDGPDGLDIIISDMHKIAMLNYELYHTVANAYAKLALALPRPAEPLRKCD
jgi:hypothetical protein